MYTLVAVGRALLDDELSELICTTLSCGVTINDTCAAVGIDPATYHSWVSKGRDVNRAIAEHAEMCEANPDREYDALDLRPQDLVYAEFADVTDKARGAGKSRALQAIFKAIDEGVWQSAAWYLERSFPKEFGRRNPDRLDQLEAAERGMDLTALPEITEERKEALILNLAKHLPGASSNPGAA